MGKFGISFSGNSYAPFRVEKKHYTTVIDLDEKSGKDGPFQKALAWASYYTMVFVALCVFNQPVMASVLSIAAPASKAIASNDTGAGWSLRGTN